MNRTPSNLIVLLLLLIITSVVYYPVLDCGFIGFDDAAYITMNDRVKDGLTKEGVAWAFSLQTGTDMFWHPLTWLSHMLDCDLYGLSPRGHHLTSLLFHLANVSLLFILLRSITGAIWPSCFVAALFALHPMNVDSVAWVAERKSVLSSFWGFLSLLAYCHYTKRPSLTRYLLIVLFFISGLLSKVTVVTLPFVMLLLDLWPLSRVRFGGLATVGRDGRATVGVLRVIIEKIPLIALSVGSVVVSLMSVGKINYRVSYDQAPIALRIANAFDSYWVYFRKLIWPTDLAIYYPYPTFISMQQLIWALIFVVGATYAGLVLYRSMPYLLVGWLWFLGILVPSSGLLQQGLWPKLADRWAYLPYIGLFIAIAWGGREIIRKLRCRRWFGLASAGLILAPFAYATRVQVGHWQNPSSIYGHALKVTEDNFFAHCAYGVALASRGLRTEAIQHQWEALRLNPHYGFSYYNLGNLFAEQGRIRDALPFYRAGLTVMPFDRDPKYRPVMHEKLGNAYLVLGKRDRARHHLLRALAEDSDYLEALAGLGQVELEAGQYAAAIGYFWQLLGIDSSNNDARFNLGIALRKSGETAQAIDAFSGLLLIDPDNAGAHNNLGWLYSSMADFDKAIHHYNEELRIRPDNEATRSNLEVLIELKLSGTNPSSESGEF